MRKTLPGKLTVDLNCPFPRWRCSVSNGIGWRLPGGFWKGFRTFADLDAWLARHGYAYPEPPRVNT